MRYTEFSKPAVATNGYQYAYRGIHILYAHTHVPGKQKRNMGVKTYLGVLSVQVVLEITG